MGRHRRAGSVYSAERREDPDKLIVVSVDSHAQPPPEAWPEYLEKRYHDFLPLLHEEQAIFSKVMSSLVNRTHSQFDVFDREYAYRSGGLRGLHNLDTRLAEMDREGIAAEFIYHGDPRFCGMFFQSSNREYPLDVCEAGVRAYHRWLYDTFGSARDRLFLVGAIGSGPCHDLREMLWELDWIADHGFVATSIPGFTGYPGQPPLFDDHWEPFWARCEERGIALWVHSGHGEMQGALGREVARVHAKIEETGGSIDDLVKQLTSEVFTGELFSSVKPRRTMWQLMLTGLFDRHRHRHLKLVMNEVHADWMPETLRHLDEVYERNRAGLPAKRSPSEYWRSNGLTCLSFVHKAEVEMRHEIGIETLSFGRDYPHTEGTWPNTREWLHDAFAGVHEGEARLILGENAVRHFSLDRARLTAIANRIGPTVEETTGAGPNVDPALIAHFDSRGGYLQPAERDANLQAIDAMVREDLGRAGMGVRSRGPGNKWRRRRLPAADRRRRTALRG